jgi:murein L,D-transpeptidase YafK
MKWTFWIFLLLLSSVIVYYFLPEPALPSTKKIDTLIVIKHKGIMEAYADDELIKTYKVSIGQHPVGDKEFEGDKKTPEGSYRINDKNPNSGYYKNLGVSYPNAGDIKEAKAKGLSPGGEIKIHGLKNGIGFIGKFHRFINWTAGCIAVTNEEMDELYEAIEVDTPIIIKP